MTTAAKIETHSGDPHHRALNVTRCHKARSFDLCEGRLFFSSFTVSLLHTRSIRLSSTCVCQVRLLLAPPGLAGLEDASSLSVVRLLFLFSASFPPPVTAPSLPPPFSLSRSLSLSRVLLALSDIFTDELLPEERDGQTDGSFLERQEAPQSGHMTIHRCVEQLKRRETNLGLRQELVNFSFRRSH